MAIPTLLVLCASTTDAHKLVTPGYLFNSDPTCRQIGDTFYLFTTQDPFTVQFERDNRYFRGMFAYHAFSTKDFDHWIDHGSILTSRDVSWNAGQALWDGDAGIPANSHYYAYAPFRMNGVKEANYGRYNIGVFTSPHIIGPYHVALNGPMKGFDGKPLEGLSPAVVRGDDGTPYLIWGSGDTSRHDVMLARLKPDMTELAEPPRRLAVRKRDSCGNLEYFESPMLFKRGDKWYLTYVAYKDAKGPRCDAHGSYVEYAVSNSMFGPFDAPARHLVYPSPGGDESVQQGICRYRGKWYIAYHVPYENVVPYGDDHHRQVAVTRLRFTADGALKPIYPDRDPGVGTPGVSALTLDAFAIRREAAEFYVRSNVAGEPGLQGEYQMKMKKGGYLRFNGMDFGTGARGFRVEVSSENPGLRKARLEVRLDNPAGALLASLAIPPGHDRNEYHLITSRVDPAIAQGRHDLVLVARGTSDNPHGYLFNVTWFGFLRQQPNDG